MRNTLSHSDDCIPRISWEQVWIEFAELISKRSADPKHKVGAIIVSDDNTQVLSVGYNGDHKGGSNLRDSMNTGKSGFIHAEINALIKCNYHTFRDKVMYVTLAPCTDCAKAIINADIKSLFYKEDYLDNSGIMLLREFGVNVKKSNF
jgi:dCMP deaminase